MAKLYVTEYADMRANMGFEPATAAQAFTFTTTTPSSAFNANTRFIRVHTDAICSIKIGTAPTATTDDARMAAGQTEYFNVYPGHKIAAVTNT